MSQKPGFASRPQQSPYPRHSHSPSPPPPNGSNLRESSVEEGRRQRDHVQEPHEAAVPSGSDAVERGPRQTAEGGPGVTYVCIEVLGGGNGSGGDGGGRGDGVEGTGEGWNLATGPSPGTWGGRGTPNAEVPSWPHGTSLNPWQAYTPSQDARLWPSKYPYVTGRSDFPQAWCAQLQNSVYSPPTQHTSASLPPSGPSTNQYMPQHIMWGPDYMDQWRYSQSRSHGYPLDGSDVGKKTSTNNFLEPTTPNETNNKSPEPSKETMIPEQRSCFEELSHLGRSHKPGKAYRHASKGPKKQNACKGSISTPLFPPVSKSPEPRTPERAIPESDEKSVKRVLSDASFVRAPTVDRSGHAHRRSHRMRYNEKTRNVETENVDSIRPAKMIKPPKPIKPVRAIKILKSMKPDSSLESTAVVYPLNVSQNIKSNKPNISKGSRPSLITPPKDVPSINRATTESSINSSPSTKPFDVLRDLPPMKGSADSHLPSVMYHQMSPEKYSNSLKPNKYSALDSFQRCNEDDTSKAKIFQPEDSQEAVRLVVPNNSLESNHINKSSEKGDGNVFISQNKSRENILLNEDPYKRYDSMENERTLGDITLNKRKSPDREKLSPRKRRLEPEKKNPSSSITQNEKECGSILNTSGQRLPSAIPRPKRSVTETTFSVHQCRCHECPSGNHRDAAVNIGPLMRTRSTQTDIEEDLGNIPLDQYRPHSNRWPSACSESQRPNSQISKEPSSAVISNDVRGLGYNPFGVTDHSFDPYLSYRAPFAYQNPEAMSPMMYGGYSPDPYSSCSNGSPRIPFWSPSPFPSYGMPMPMPMHMAMHMCMPMGMPVTVPCSCDTSSVGTETRRHVDAAVGDSREDNRLLEEEPHSSKSRSRSFFGGSNDIVNNIENYTPSARKKLELLLAGLTPRGKTLHPERLNSLLSDIPPEVIKKILEESPAEKELSSMIKGENGDIVHDESNRYQKILAANENLPSEESISTGDEQSNNDLNKKGTTNRTDSKMSGDETETEKGAESIEENNMKLCENGNLQDRVIIQNSEKQFMDNGEHHSETRDHNNMSKDEKNEGENTKTIKNRIENPQEMRETVKIHENNGTSDQENHCNNTANNLEDHRVNSLAIEPIHIKLRTRPLFRNQELRDSTTNTEEYLERVQKTTVSTSKDTLSIATSINPDTSVSEDTTLEVVGNAVSTASRITKTTTQSKCSEVKHKTQSDECTKDVKDNMVDVSVEAKPEQYEQSISTSIDTKEEIELSQIVYSVERRYSISPCPGVSFTSSKPPTWNPPRKSRPTSASRPVTVSPLRPLPRPTPIPRFTAPSPLATARRRRQLVLSEGGSASVGNLRAPPRSGSIRPPRARIPARLLQANVLSTDTDTAKKSCPWSRLSFVERTALARALVDSSSCTVKVGDATVQLARSGLSSLMSIAEGILNQTRTTRSPAPQNERRTGKSPKRSPIRVNPSPPPERGKLPPVDTSNEMPIAVRTGGDNHPPRIIIPERRFPHIKRLINIPARTSSDVNNTSGSRNSARNAKTDSKSGTKKISSASRAYLRSKGSMALTSTNQNDLSVCQKEDKSSPEREVKRLVPRTGRYCSMRITNCPKRPESPILLPPPRGFRGRGVSYGIRGFGIVTKRCEGNVSKERNAKGDGNSTMRGTKEMLFDSNSSISSGASRKSQKNAGKGRKTQRGKIVKSRSQNEETKSSLGANAVKSKSLNAKSVYTRKNIEETVIPTEGLSNEKFLLKRLTKKCKSLALVDTLLTKLSKTKLSCPTKRSTSSPSVTIHDSEKMLRRKSEKADSHPPNRLTRSGNILYRPPGYTGSRYEYELKNSEILRITTGDSVNLTPSKTTRTPSLGAKREPTTKSTSQLPLAHPINSAPPRPSLSSSETTRARTYTDDCCILNPKRHTPFADRRSHPRLPVTAVAAAQRALTRSRSNASPTPSLLPGLQTSCKIDDGGAAVADLRSTTRARSSSPVRTPPTPWRDKRITNDA